MKQKFQGILIIVLLVTNAIAVYFAFRPLPITPVHEQNFSLVIPGARNAFFNQPLDDSAALSNVHAFRKSANAGSLGVLYDADTIERYLKTDYPRIRDQMSKVHPGYDWRIGFYWMFTKGKDSVNRLSFCVIPTLVSHSDSTRVVDYFTDTVWYKQATISRQVTDPKSDKAYDEGQLWP